MSQNFTKIYEGVAVLVLGMSAGAMWTEAVVMVNFWEALAPVDFLVWYRAHHGILVGFYSPLQITTTLIALGAPVVTRLAYGRWNPAWIVSTVFALAVIAMFFLFFKSANAAFLTDNSDLAARIPEMLRTWSQWQWLRTAMGVVSAIGGIVALGSRTRSAMI